MKNDFKQLAKEFFCTEYEKMFMLAYGGNKEAIKWVKKNLDDISSDVSGKNITNGMRNMITENEFESIVLSLAIGETTVYNQLTSLFYQGNQDNFFDVNCGMTPRPLNCSANKKTYLGIDNYIDSAVANRCASRCTIFKKQKSDYFKSGGMLDSPLILSAVGSLQGSVFVFNPVITVDNKIEFQRLCETINELLTRNDCTIFSCDTLKICDNILEILMDDSIAYEYYIDKRKEEFKKRGVAVDALFTDEGDLKNALSENGLRVTEMAFSNDNIPKDLLRPLREEKVAKILVEIASTQMWKLDVASDTENKKTGIDVEDTGDLIISHSVQEGKLLITLNGVVDTKTSPKLLDIFEKLSEENTLDKIYIDMADVQYMSSSGLRVLMIMSSKVKDIAVAHVNDAIKDVLCMTGFDVILRIL